MKSKENSKNRKTNTSEKDKKKTKRAKVVVPKFDYRIKPNDMSLEEWQIALRQQQATVENFVIEQIGEKSKSDTYSVTNLANNNHYKVVYRGKASQWNYCSCFDFKTSQLGTCKHLEAVKIWAKKKRIRNIDIVPAHTSVYVDYKGPRKVRIRIGTDSKEEFEKLAAKYFDNSLVLKAISYDSFADFLKEAKAIDESFRCYDDALKYVAEQRDKKSRVQLVETKYSDEVLDKLLTVKLYDYQKEGIRFSVKSGSSIIADEMGLGKTIQAIGAAEIFQREGLADNVLIVCPTSLKYQWKKEIEKFTGCVEETIRLEHDIPCPKVVVVEGNAAKRVSLYKSKAPYKIVSYHTMCNDIRALGHLDVDVLIMDEVQRLKNWDTLISKAARKIEARYKILLSGTPLENKLEELYSTMELADQFCFEPYYKFRDNHIILDPITGKVVGYKNLNEVGRQAGTRLIRRTKKGVQLQLPKRTDEYILVPLTNQQAGLHTEFKNDLSMIVSKYLKTHYLSEQDRLRMMKSLSQMRMVSDSTYILDQDERKHYDFKVDEVMNLLDSIFANGDDKVVIFSEWERMTRLVAMELDKRNVRYEYLCGKLSAKQRGEIVENFRNIPESRVFLSTDAGSTGLNLQVASVLINLDLPWNPAVLEQRIARVYRLGQEKPVHIIDLVSKGSIEESMIDKLRFKTSMFEGVLDGGEDTIFVSDEKFKKFMDDLVTVVNRTEPVSVEYIEEESSEEDVSNLSEEHFSEEELVGGDLVEDKDEEFENNDYIPVSNEEIETSKSNESSPNASKISSNSTTSPTTNSNVNGEGLNDNPKQLVQQGISFFAGLAETLKSPETTRQLVDSIVEEDNVTGETHIKIPVANKEMVTNIFELLGKMMNQ